MFNKIKRLLSIVMISVIIFCMIAPMQVHAASSHSTLVGVQQGVATTVTITNNDGSQIMRRVPLFNQWDYRDVPYGEYGSIADYGCGITCVSMVSTYLTNRLHSPVDMALRFGNYNTEVGSSWSLFWDSAEILGIKLLEQTDDWETVKRALENGHLVVCLQSAGLFTDGGHYMVLTGINEDGRIMVNDSNGYNWRKNQELRNGFKNGFTEQQITQNDRMYWIYDTKTVNEPQT